MFTFEAQQRIHGDRDAVWATWTDPDRFPEWDPREERTSLSGPFAVGSTIDSKQKGNPGGVATITEVLPRQKWTAESGLPGGKLVIEHLLSQEGDGDIIVSKKYVASGPMSVLFRCWYGPRVRRALPETFSALEREAASLG